MNDTGRGVRGGSLERGKIIFAQTEGSGFVRIRNVRAQKYSVF